MGTFLSFIIVIGLIAALIGDILILVAAFKRSPSTGFRAMFLGGYFSRFAFANKRKAFALMVGGFALAIIGVVIHAVVIQ